MGKNVRDINGEQGEFVVTNFTQRLTFDCDTAVIGEVADTLGTLIKILSERGDVSATVT